ncbi:MAG: 4a-hydroxytetrahydrobiopterin dehydratase [Solirubrobacteraceae bacterium]
MAQLLTEEEIEGRLRDAQWMREGETIVREQQFADFAAALAFVNRVAAVAEERNHHPDILLHSWNKVRLTVSTHSAGGLTQADFDLASEVDGLL